MDKRYQVFVSSTYEDLRRERQEVMQALLSLHCIPTGMELFPAANEDQWTVIKRVIDECDYYIVIIGGRYGSIKPSGRGKGKSYTQLEYEYAISRSKPVMAFYHSEPGKLPADQTESKNPAKLRAFRDLVKKKMCKPWVSSGDLGKEVITSLVHMMNSSPAVGWVRADQVASTGAAEQILKLKERTENLEAELRQVRTSPPIGTESLAHGNDATSVRFRFQTVNNKNEYTLREYYSISITWNDIFRRIGPRLQSSASEGVIGQEIGRILCSHSNKMILEANFSEKLNEASITVEPDCLNFIIIQFRALGLIHAQAIHNDTPMWRLTPYGDQVIINLLAERRKS